MAAKPVSLGQVISEARKTKKLSQKELAEKIYREEDDKAISPQYLNDIERDRRSPSSDHMISQFAKILGLDSDYLHYLNGRIPPDVRKKQLSEEAVAGVMKVFRKSSK